MYSEDLALNNLQWLICHKTQPNQTQGSTLTVPLSLKYSLGTPHETVNLFFVKVNT